MSYYNNNKFGDSEDWKKPFFEYNSLEKLEKLNAKGPDEDLEVSLFGFGFVWVKNDSKHTFVYGLKCDEHARMCRFDLCTFDRKKFDFFKTYRYLDWNRFFQHYQTDFQTWTRKPFGFRMYDVYCFFGAANTFFARLRYYQEGFEVKI